METVQRHMEAPCDSQTALRCLYVRQAIEYFFEDGTLVRAKAYRRDRPVSDPPPDGEKYFGSFRGEMRPRIMMGLHRHIVVEEFGEPLRIEKVGSEGSVGLVERHFYDGVTIEYDLIENGNTVVSAMEVFPSASVEVDAMGFVLKKTAP